MQSPLVSLYTSEDGTGSATRPVSAYNATRSTTLATWCQISAATSSYCPYQTHVPCFDCQVPPQVLAAPSYALAFALAPRVCHAFASTLSGLTGEALSDALADLDAGRTPAWDRQTLPAPVLAYWGLLEGASMRSVLLVMRADVNARMIINQGADFRMLSLVRKSDQQSLQ